MVEISAKIKKKKPIQFSMFGIINTTLLVLFAIAAVYPFYNIFVYAFNDGKDALRGVLYFWPRVFTLNNFTVALSQDGIFNAFKISVAKTVIGTILSVLATSSLAYAMTKRFLPGYKALSYYFFITFLFGGGLVPYFLTLRMLGLYNTFWVFIIPGMYNYWNMIIFRSFFDTIPSSIEESAKMDGASDFTIFLRLIIPLSKPVFAAIGLFTAIAQWNDWFTGTFFIKNTGLVPLQTLLQQIMNQANMATKLMEISGDVSQNAFASVTPYAIRLAIVVITVTPIILVYPFLQKYIVKGIMIGAVKG